MKRAALILSLLLALASTLPAQSTPSFELKRDTNTINGGAVVVQGDFNKDGKPDFIVAGGQTYSDLTLRLGNGDGTFQPPVVVGTAISPSGGITDLIAADLDHDGNLDLVVVYTAMSFQVFYGNGNGTFQAPLSFSTTGTATSVTAADFNGDGLLDIAIGDQAGNVEIFNNLGGQDFVLASTVHVTSAQPGILRVRAADIDANGTADLAVLTYTAAYVLWGSGHSTFTPVQLATYAAANDLNVGDVNQDGIADILVSYNCGGFNPPPARNPYVPCTGIDVFYGQGHQTTFHRLAVSDLGVEASTPWTADVNGDGIADLVEGSLDQNSQAGLFVWLGHPDGSFDQTPQRFIAASTGGSAIAPGDWNRDGMIDFVQILPSIGAAQLYINGANRAPCATSSINHTVTVCLPVNNTFMANAISVQANAFDTTPISSMQVYLDNKLVFGSSARAGFSVTFTPALSTPGPHFLVTKAWDAKGVSFRSDRNITSYTGNPGAACPAALGTARICLPTAASASSPLHILANGYTSVIPTAAQLYIDGKLVVNDAGCIGYCSGGTSYIDTTQTLAKGTHDLYFKLWDASGRTYTSQKIVTIQ